MKDYTLPRTENGEVHWEYLYSALEDAFCDGSQENLEWAKVAIKAIDANARAEERERCAKVCRQNADILGHGGPTAHVLHMLSNKFRNMSNTQSRQDEDDLAMGGGSR